MDFLLDRDNMKQLAQLLRPDDVESNSSDEDDDEDLPKTGVSTFGPGDIKHVKVRVRGNTDSNEDSTDGPGGDNVSKRRNSKAIWQLDEVPEVAISDDASYDPREKPEYEIKYRQSVTPEDMFLQLGLKTSASASCEAMTLITCLKGETHDDVDLQVTKSHLDIRSPRYRLSLPLPHPVHTDKCTAEWDNDSQTLNIYLILNRELDFVNF